MSRIRDAATQYIAAGYAVVPIQRGAKRPADSDWLKKSFTAEDFDDTCNIGIKAGAHSAGLVDVDCDTADAIKAAALLLPQTGLIHGRRSKPASHYWFKVSAETPSQQFQDLDGSMLLELRSTGLQTVVPPSLHESGEEITWVTERTPMTIDSKELQLATRATGIAVLFGRYWPVGSRHVAAGNLAGFLARCGFDAQWVAQIVKTAATLAGDDEISDRVRYARETAQKHERGERTTGGPTIIDSFERGKELVARVLKWIEREGDTQIEELNARHFVVRLGKDMAVGMEEEEGVVFQNYTGFQQMYCDQRVGKVDLGRFWLNNPLRRKFRTITFAPPGSNEIIHPDDYNLWRGYACEPDPLPHPERRIPRYLEHVHRVICDGNTVFADYVLDLLADCVQAPGRPSGKALVLRGRQGTGKSVFVEAFAKSIFRRHWVSVSSPKEIVRNFNAIISGKVVVFADEAVWGGNKQDAGTLKKLVTQDRINIERKGLDVVTEANCIHLFLATNESWAWPVGDCERRAVILDLPKPIPHGDPYWSALWQEVERPGFGPALLAYLLQRPVDAVRLRYGLDTPALRELADMSADVERKWWKQVCDDGQAGWTPGWPTFVDHDWCWAHFRDENPGYRSGRRDFLTAVHKLLPPGARVSTKKLIVDRAKGFGVPNYVRMAKRGFSLPDLDKCRQWLDGIAGMKSDWTPPPVEEHELPKELLDLATGADAEL